MRAILLRALALVALWAAAAHAEEILSYDVGVEVMRDGTLDVTETIRVTVAGDQVKRGIIRDFPVEYREADGRTSLASFDLLGVRRNGKGEPYHQSRAGANASIRIGKADVFLPVPSEQTYEIHYRTQGQLRALDGYDELYWNVTGDQWEMPIRAASVEIRLPDGTPILQHAAYTGPRGAKGGDYQVLEAANGTYRARITVPLGRHEGFTTAVGWPPGVVEVPPVRYGTSRFGSDVNPLGAVVATLAGTLALLLGWVRVGRDPPGGAIYPQFEPPSGLSPAATRYVKRMGFDNSCLTAAILNMAVKGALRIREKPPAGLFRNKGYSLEPLGSQDRHLTSGERVAYAKLFPTGGVLELSAGETSGARVDGARTELNAHLWSEHYGASFRRNTLCTLGGATLGAVTLMIFAAAARWNAVPIVQWVIPAALAGLLTYALGFLWFEIHNVRRGAGIAARRAAVLVPFMMVAGMIGYAFVMDSKLWIRLEGLNPLIIAAGTAFGIVLGLFHFLMAAPSKAGRKLMDQIAGFEMYMRTAEEERLNILNPPEHTPELFERLLPYAVALGVAHQWSRKFATVLAVRAAPAWYVGGGRFDVDRFDRDFGHAVASTSVPSRGSGGSGGGGFSGGGGGGGGGRGW